MMLTILATSLRSQNASSVVGLLSGPKQKQAVTGRVDMEYADSLISELRNWAARKWETCYQTWVMCRITMFSANTDTIAYRQARLVLDRRNSSSPCSNREQTRLLPRKVSRIPQ